MLDGEVGMEIPKQDLEIVTLQTRMNADERRWNSGSGRNGQCLSYTRSGGNINRVDVTVRIVHIPTGIAACARNERSQQQNKEKALTLLRSKLYAITQLQGVEDVGEIRTELLADGVLGVLPIIRDYLCTRTLDYFCVEGQVKDYRTGVETTAIADVMNGLDSFIHAYLLYNPR